MRLLGVEKVSELGPRCVSNTSCCVPLGDAYSKTQINSRAVERDIYDGEAGLEKPGLWFKANL